MKTKKINWASIIFVFIVSFYLLMPILSISLYSISVNWTTQLLPEQFTFNYYTELFAQADFWAAILRSIFITVISVGICLCILLLAIFVVIVYFPKFEKWMSIIITIPYAISGVILASSLLSIYAAGPWPFSNRMLLLVCAYCVIILPYMYQGIRNSLYGINVHQLLEVAEILKCNKFWAYITIIVPNIVSGITVSSLLSAAIVFGDFVLVKTIAGTSFFTIQYYLFNAMLKSGSRGGAVVFVAFIITIALSFTGLYIQNKSNKHNKA